MADNIEKVKASAAVLTAAAALVVPVVVGFVGNNYAQAMKEREIAYAQAMKEREIGARFVEIGVGILQQPPTDESKNLRIWAIDVLNKHSDVKIDGQTRTDLTKMALPSPTTWSSAPPQSAYCYQEEVPTRRDALRYSIYCQPTEQLCKRWRGGNPQTRQSQCVRLELTNMGWNPQFDPATNFWYAHRAEPFPPPFPPPPAN